MKYLLSSVLALIGSVVIPLCMALIPRIPNYELVSVVALMLLAISATFLAAEIIRVKEKKNA